MRLTLDLETEIPEAERLINFCIYIAPQPTQYLVLNGAQTLQQVNEKFWRVRVTTKKNNLFSVSITVFFHISFNYR